MTESYPEDEEPEATDEEATKVPSSDNSSDQEHEPPEVTALKLELSTLTTSYTSSQSTLQLVQVELQEERRVNQALQVSGARVSVGRTSSKGPASRYRRRMRATRASLWSAL